MPAPYHFIHVPGATGRPNACSNLCNLQEGSMGDQVSTLRSALAMILQCENSNVSSACTTMICLKFILCVLPQSPGRVHMFKQRRHKYCLSDMAEKKVCGLFHARKETSETALRWGHNHTSILSKYFVEIVYVTIPWFWQDQFLLFIHQR